MRNHVLVITVLSASCGCRPQTHNDTTLLPQSVEQFRSSQTNSANLTESEVKKLAIDLAKQEKQNLDDYKSPMISFDSVKGQWWVWFDHKPSGYPGGDFFVRVNDKTKSAEFLPGE
jgi:hypothetical protein